jgi:hypothetical protein
MISLSKVSYAKKKNMGYDKKKKRKSMPRGMREKKWTSVFDEILYKIFPDCVCILVVQKIQKLGANIKM